MRQLILKQENNGCESPHSKGSDEQKKKLLLRPVEKKRGGRVSEQHPHKEKAEMEVYCETRLKLVQPSSHINVVILI